MDEYSFSKIVLCIDNSDISHIASEVTLDIARAFGSAVVGIHGYNAFMHEGAFRIMEPVLPQKYQKEQVLQKQREVHKRLINVGMEKISLSYLKPLEEKFASADINFRIRVKEGKNFKAVNEILDEEGNSIVVIGASGFNSNGNGFVGSVCLRVLRGNNRNILIIRKHLNLDRPKFVACLDGSSSAIHALKMAKTFADKYSAEIHLVYVFDSALHNDIFERLKESVINREGFSFSSKGQKRIHDEFIDKGLARVGNMILDKADKEVFGLNGSASMSIGDGFGLVGGIDSIRTSKMVLEGNIYKRICDYASEIKADLIFVGRTGRHYVDGVDIGSVTENVVRFAPCSVFVAKQEPYRGWEL